MMNHIAIFKGGPIGGEIHAVRDEGRYHRVPVFASSPISAGAEPSPYGPTYVEHTYEWQGETEYHQQTGERMRVMRWQDPSTQLQKSLDREREISQGLRDQAERMRKGHAAVVADLYRSIDVAKRLLRSPAFVDEAVQALDGALD